MPRLKHPEPPEPLMMLSPAPGSEAQRAVLYATDRGRFNKLAWLQTGAGIELHQALAQMPLAAPISHFLKHSLLKRLLPTATGTPTASPSSTTGA